MNYKNELENLRKKVERKKHLKALTKVLQDKYSELSLQLEKLKKKKKRVVEYEKTLSEYETVKDKLKKSEDELLGLKDCEKQYELILKKCMEEVRIKGGEDAKQLELLEKKLMRLEKRKKEVACMYNEGCTAFELGRDTVKRLESAKKWGLADIFGGGIIASKGKFDYIYEAQGYLVEFKLQLSRFNDAFEKTNVNDEQLRIDFSDKNFESMWLDHIELDVLDVSFEFGHDIQTQVNVLSTRNKVVAVCGELKEVLIELKKVVENTKMRYNEARNDITDFLVNVKEVE